MGRRWGKTVLGGCISLATAAQGGKVAWVVPTYKNGRPLWRWAEAAVGGLQKAKLAQANRSERVIEFKHGGLLGLYSMDNENSIRGESFHLVIVDEAAMIQETAWLDAIQPTLADYDGDAILISTPKGQNWFWREWIKGLSGGLYAAFQAPTAANPSANIQKAARLAQERVPDRTYRQEWLAEFVEDGGVFRLVRQAATAKPQERAAPGHEYVMGADWGKHNDFTVLTVLDVTTKQQVAIDRFNQIDYSLQRQRLRALWERFGRPTVIAEQNSMGDPVIEQLQREGIPVQPFQTTNASKASAIEALALAFERSELAILDDPIQLGELLAYQTERLPSGSLRYTAPAGMHDDCVMSLALCWSGVAQSGPLVWGLGGDDE